MPVFNAAGLIRHGIALGMLCGLAVPALGGNALFNFDIPAQPLSSALNKYASLTERAALFRSDVVAGRTSTAVQGRYTPEAALSLMVQGTGLALEKIATGPSDTFVLKPASPPTSSMQAALTDAGDYPALLQIHLWDALCRSARTAPGRYRALLRFQVDGMGEVRDVQLLGSTGDADRDAAMLDALEHVRMNAPPPPAMPQPLTMVILPNAPGRADGGMHCGMPPP